ncbi:MAG TPA: hypothetical protein DD730_02720 [Desulfosporosinus sp.]|nr:hypothetical protein [Desulfosporosinus sp.]
MAGTLSIIMMLSTPTLAQAQVVSDISPVLLMGQSEIAGLKLKARGVDITGLNVDLARKKVKVTFVTATAKVNKNHQAKTITRLSANAEKLGINITDLTKDQARTKIKSVERANTLTHLLDQAKILGIGVDISNKS